MDPWRDVKKSKDQAQRRGETVGLGTAVSKPTLLALALRPQISPGLQRPFRSKIQVVHWNCGLNGFKQKGPFECKWRLCCLMTTGFRKMSEMGLQTCRIWLSPNFRSASSGTQLTWAPTLLHTEEKECQSGLHRASCSVLLLSKLNTPFSGDKLLPRAY